MPKIIKKSPLEGKSVVFKCEFCGCEFSEKFLECFIVSGDNVSYEEGKICVTKGDPKLGCRCPTCHSPCTTGPNFELV